MENFRLQIPTDIIFGKDTHLQIGEEVKKYADKILLIRIKKQTLQSMGVYDDIINSLLKNNIEYIELDGVLPNPRLSKVNEGVEICKKNNIKFILAIGGGSVIDSAKAIAAGACMNDNVWDIFTGKHPFEKSLMIGTILTIPATASEMNTRCVITNDETSTKRGTTLAYPTFSILNPDFCKSLPTIRKAQGIVDILAHSMERYFTNTEHIELMDRMLESLMKTVVIYAEQFCNDEFSYDIASQIVYASTLSHNFTLCVGRVNDFASHNMSHDLSGLYDLPHGEALSILFPAWLKFVKNHNKNRVMQFFVNVFNIEPNFLNVDETIDKGIKTLEKFYIQLNMPIRISDTNIKNFDIEEVLDRITNKGTIKIGNYMQLDKEQIREIILKAL